MENHKTGAMKKTDLVFVDTESTGLNTRYHELIEIAFVRVSQDWNGDIPKFEIVDEWAVKIKPQNILLADSIALKINGYTKEDWKDAIDIKEALKQFSQKTEGAIMVSHNVASDAGFLDTYFDMYKIENKMHYHRLDTVSMAFVILKNNDEVIRYSLGELCKYFGIVNEKAHSALADARADFELFKKLIYLQNNDGEKS